MLKAKKKKTIDIGLIIISSLFIFIGIICMATASPPFALKNDLSSNYYLLHQLMYGFIPGIILAFIASIFSLEKLKKISPILFIISLVFMFLALIPGIGIFDGGASRWVHLGPISFQPSEFLKLTSMIYFAALFSNSKRENNIVPFGIVSGLIVLSLYLQSDLSSFVTIMAINFSIFFTSKSTKIKEYFICGAALLVLISGLAFSSSYRMERIATVFDQSDVGDAAYQTIKVKDSIGSGGWFGLGLGMSAQKFGFVPETISDSIFAIYAEELGFVGCLTLISLLIIFLLKSFSIAENSKDEFSKLLATGVGVWIVCQSLINILAMSGIFPVCGTPLPFLSYGGTHIIAEVVALGLLINTSRN